MNCPKCDFLSEVLKTVKRDAVTYRLRRCLHCKETFSTSERRNSRRKLKIRQSPVIEPEICELKARSVSAGETSDEEEALVRAEHARRHE
jgi:hypothetical protein